MDSNATMGSDSGLERDSGSDPLERDSGSDLLERELPSAAPSAVATIASDMPDPGAAPSCSGAS
jgi:hypothetical protein